MLSVGLRLGGESVESWTVRVLYSKDNRYVKYSFTGNVQYIQNILLTLVQRDKHRDMENWVSGAECTGDITERMTDSECTLYAYANYKDCSVEYIAECKAS